MTLFSLVVTGLVGSGTLFIVHGCRARYELPVELRKATGLPEISFGIVFLSLAVAALLMYGVGSALAIR